MNFRIKYSGTQWLFCVTILVLIIRWLAASAPLLLASPEVQSSSANLVKDINSTTLSGYPRNLTNINGILYFTIDDGVHAYELWTSDGTVAGTRLVKDISDEKNGSFPAQFTEVNGNVFFSASDGLYNGLWKTDGTEAGTVLVKNLLDDNLVPQGLVNVGGMLYFKAKTRTNGYELWKSDGTASGTVMVKDIRSGLNESNPEQLTAVNRTLFFVADDGVHGYELWKSDGTAAGTVLVKDIWPLTPNSGISPFALTSFNNALYFFAYDGTRGIELWKSDGTESGTTMVVEIRPGNHADHYPQMIHANNLLYFTFNDGIHGVEIWKSDGSAAGTTLVKDLFPDSLTGNPSYLTNVNGTLFFTTKLGQAAQLWKSDGTPSGTVVVQTMPMDVGYLVNLTNVNGTLNFWTSDNKDGLYKRTVFSPAGQLWKSNGTTVGTVLIKDVWTGVYGSLGEEHAAVGNQLFFEANDGKFGFELWKSDGTANNTQIVRDVVTTTANADPSYPVIMNDTLYFSAYDGQRGDELWRSDGTNPGTTLVKDIRTVNFGLSNSAEPKYLTVFNNKVYFSAKDDAGIPGLWQSDGTENGTRLLKSVAPNPINSGEVPFLVVGDVFYFAGGGNEGVELWKSNGTADGTVIVKDISTNYDSNPQDLTAVNNIVYFIANDGIHGEELWRSDGTSAGTVLVKDIQTGADSSYPQYLTNVNGLLYFNASDGPNGFELWKSDGTATGTVMVKDLPPFSSNPINLMAANGLLFFTTFYSGVEGQELWRSDGTSAGTFIVKDIQPGEDSSYVMPAFSFNNNLFFLALGTTGVELWKSNGVTDGTVRIKTLAAEQTSAFAIRSPVFWKGKFYFRFETAFETIKDQIWRTDGTSTGTEMVYQTTEASSNSVSQFLIAASERLYLGDDDGVHGIELWALSPSANSQPSANDQSVTATEDTARSITLTANDIDGNPLTYSIVNNPGHGTLTGSGANRTYTPAANYHGPDSFTFKVNDGQVDSNVATVNITVNPVNDPPTAAGQNVTTNEDTALSISLTGNDVEGSALTYTIVANPTKGTLSSSGANRTYTPSTNANGTDSFTFKINDGQADSNIATVTITVNPVNDPPTATGQSVTTNEDTAKAITLAGNDVEGSALTFTVVTNPTKGTLSGSGASRTYTPNANVNGTDSFTFKVNDGQLDSAVATVNLTINAVNDPPSATPQSVNTNKNMAKVITLTGSDVEGSALTFSIVSNPTKGTLSGTAPNLTYTPATNYTGSDSFTFKANDGAADSPPATVSITVNATNGAPTANGQTVTTNEDVAKPITLTGSDPDSDGLTFAIVTPPSRGSLSGSAPNLTYTPTSNLNGSDSFTFRVSDGQLTSAPATVNITVNPVNDPPLTVLLNNDRIEENEPAGTLIGLLSSNDVDSGDSHSYTVVGGDITAFTLVGNQLQSAIAFDYETKPLYQLTIRSTDQGGATVDTPLTIAVLDVNEGPSMGTLTVVLALQPENKSNFKFSGTLGNFSLDDITPQDSDHFGNSRTFTSPAGSVTVIAKPPAKWLLQSISCTTTEGTLVDLPLKRVTVTLTANAQITCTFTLGLPTTVRVQNYNDLNANGQQDRGERGLGNWSFTLYDAAGTALTTQVSNRQGKATFINVPPGSYRLCEAVMAGWQNTQPATIDPNAQRPCYLLTLPAAQVVTLFFGNTTAAVGQIPASTAIGTITAERTDGDVEEEEYDAPTNDDAWLLVEEGEEGEEAVEMIFLPMISR